MGMVVTRLSHVVDGRTSVVVLKRSAGTIPEHVFVVVAAGALALIVIMCRFMAIFHMHRSLSTSCSSTTVHILVLAVNGIVGNPPAARIMTRV